MEKIFTMVGINEADAALAADIYNKILRMGPEAAIELSKNHPDAVIRDIANLVLHMAARYARENGQAAAA